MTSRKMEDFHLNTDEAWQKIKQIPETINEALGVLKNDVDLLVHQIDSQEGQEDQQVLQTLTQVTTQNQQVANELRRYYNILNGVVEYLKKEIKTWQEQFQLYYAKLGHQPDLDRIATQCAATGLTLHVLLSVSFKQWGDILDILEVFDSHKMKEECTTQLPAFQSLWEMLVQSTFVVTSQEEFVVRKMKKCFPPFCIRLLAADYMYGHVGEVTPYFVSEVDLKKCVQGDKLKLEELKKKQIKVQNVAKKQRLCERLELKSQKGTDKMECVCKNITFEEDFKRHQNKDIKVHEEKFRVVFITQLESQTIWTMSLPLVVISASNQEVNSLASIMWQCFSTNVFCIHEEIPTTMKWSSVARMLGMKFAVISKHNLTKGNIKHLKRQLFGVGNQPDDTPVSLPMFCCGDSKRTMKNFTSTESKKDAKDIPYSFWKWFLGVFNVIEDFLLPYWNDGLIMAFVGRQQLKQELLKCKESGTFVLRFSDTEISDRDGVKNVHGRLKASVFCIKYKAEESGKRKNAGQGHMFEEKVVEDLDLDDPPKNLANILKDERKLFYRYLYPYNKTRQELFDKYYEEKEEMTLANIGYKKPSDVGWSVLDLEQAVKQVNILTGSSPQAIPESESDSRIIKKAKRQKEHSYDYETDEGPLVTEQKEFVSQMSGNSSISPSYLEQSPEQSVPNFSFPAHHRNSNGDSVVPYSPDNGNGTAMEEDSFAASERNSTALYQTSYTNGGGIASPEGENHSEYELNLSFGAASTPEAPNQPLTGNDNLISGSCTDNGSNEKANALLYGAGWHQQRELSFLESNTKLTGPVLNELRQTLTPDRYRYVLSWTQKTVELQTNFTSQSAHGGEITNNHPDLENKEGVTNVDLSFGQLLQSEGNGFEGNSLSEDLLDMNDLIDLMEEQSNEQFQLT